MAANIYATSDTNADIVMQINWPYQTGYSTSFTEEDWTEGDDGYTFTLPASIHGAGLNFCADVWRLSDDGKYQTKKGYPTKGYTVTVSETGDVTIASAVAFAGKIVIR